jgi:hypothetical protein
MRGNHAQIILSLRQLLAATQMQNKVREKMFPHLRRESDHDDPFVISDRDELTGGWLHAALDLQADLQLIEKAASGIPTPYNEILCFIAYRDLRDRMRMYQDLAAKLSSAVAALPH